MFISVHPWSKAAFSTIHLRERRHWTIRRRWPKHPPRGICRHGPTIRFSWSFFAGFFSWTYRAWGITPRPMTKHRIIGTAIPSGTLIQQGLTTARCLFPFWSGSSGFGTCLSAQSVRLLATDCHRRLFNTERSKTSTNRIRPTCHIRYSSPSRVAALLPRMPQDLLCPFKIFKLRHLRNRTEEETDKEKSKRLATPNYKKLPATVNL